MLEQLKKQALQQAMKLMSNPKFTKMMSDPRVMNLLTKGFEIHGQVRSTVEGSIKSMVESLNLATKDEVSTIERNMSKLESGLVDLQAQVEKSAAKKKAASRKKKTEK